jgi:4-amino-4-deoxy-L-arabinose transferase-like glycosyltransferase
MGLNPFPSPDRLDASRSHPDTPAERAARTPRRAAVGLAGVCALAALIFFFHLGTYGLWEPDEGRYAEIAREMLATRDFIVPHLNYVPYIEKPPLLYWLTALSMSLFGVNEFAARLVAALAAIAGVSATFGFALATFDRRRAIMAGVVLTTSALYAVMAQVLTTDMLLTAALAMALYAFFMHWRDGGRWCWLSYLAMGLAVLTKGPVGAAIPIVVGLIFLWREHDLAGLIARFRMIPGLVLTAVIAAPWFILITLREPGFFDFYFIGEHLRRFFQPGYSHGQPMYYFVPIMLAGLMPWTLALPFVPWRRLDPNPARRFCLIAGATIFVVFSLASAKLAPYVLPAFPPLAIVIADGILAADDDEFARRRLIALGALLALAGALAIAIGILADRFQAPYPLMVRPAMYAAGAILIAGGAACAVAFAVSRAEMGLAIFTVVAAAALIAVSYGRIMAEPMRSYAQLARAIERAAPDARLVCFPRYVQSLPFYTHRRVILVGDRTELTFGADHAADANEYFFYRRDDLIRLWNDPRPTVFVIDRFVIDALRPILGRWRVVASDRKKIAITRAGIPAASVQQFNE